MPVGVWVKVGVRVGVEVEVGVNESVGLGVRVCVTVAVGVGVREGVWLHVAVAVQEEVGEGVMREGLGVAVGVGDGKSANRFCSDETIQRTLKPIMKRNLGGHSPLGDVERTRKVWDATAQDLPCQLMAGIILIPQVLSTDRGGKRI